MALAKAEAKLGSSLWPPLRALYARADGGTVGDVDVFTLAELADANGKKRGWKKALLFFASDGAGGFFGVDLDGSVKPPSGSIVWVDRSSSRRASAVPCAKDLPSFLRDVAAGKLTALDEKALLAELAARPERWEGKPGLDIEQLAVASHRCGVPTWRFEDLEAAARWIAGG